MLINTRIQNYLIGSKKLKITIIRNKSEITYFFFLIIIEDMFTIVDYGSL